MARENTVAGQTNELISDDVNSSVFIDITNATIYLNLLLLGSEPAS